GSSVVGISAWRAMASEVIQGDEWGAYVMLGRSAPPERGITMGYPSRRAQGVRRRSPALSTTRRDRLGLQDWAVKALGTDGLTHPIAAPGIEDEGFAPPSVESPDMSKCFPDWKKS